MTKRFSVLRASAWAVTWAVGVAIGVAVGGWLTVVGSAAAPGVAALEPTEDLVLLPLAAGAAMFVLHFSGQVVVHLWRGRRSSQDGGQHYDDGQSAEDDGVDGQIGREGEATADRA